ncbi:MAG: adenine phosphoribosyltransferase [Bacteroidales bacterium]|jgi:adenine phosphoribosyltransferase|nr:adenine phosphoribosyltransferase [Bacteroidales bacterium]
MNKYLNFIRPYEGFPKQDVIFQDINPLLSNWQALRAASADLAIMIKQIMPFPSKIVCVEARGFLMGGIIAASVCAGCVPVRKKGKLPPYESIENADYELEYGVGSISMDTSLIANYDDIVIFDDVLATGGTAEAVYRMLASASEKGKWRPLEERKLCFAFLLEIKSLEGRRHLIEKTGIPDSHILSLIQI